jgi:hypothetical protein
MEAIGIVGVVVLGMLGLAGLVVISAVTRGFVLTKLWLWFIVPTFGLPKLSIPIAIGLALVVGLLTEHSNQHKDDRETSDKVAAIIGSLLTPFLVLLCGYIVTLWL